MKNANLLLVLGLVLVLGFAPAAGCASGAPRSGDQQHAEPGDALHGWSWYESEAFHLRFRLPGTWQVSEAPLPSGGTEFRAERPDRRVSVVLTLYEDFLHTLDALFEQHAGAVFPDRRYEQEWSGSVNGIEARLARGRTRVGGDDSALAYVLVGMHPEAPVLTYAATVVDREGSTHTAAEASRIIEGLTPVTLEPAAPVSLPAR